MDFDKLKNSTNSNITIHILSKKVIAVKCFITNAQESIKKVKPLTPFLMALIIILESNQPRKKVMKATIETKE